VVRSIVYGAPPSVAQRNVTTTALPGGTAMNDHAHEAAATDATNTVRIRITTAEGVIEALIDTAHAPLTAANFLRYLDSGFYDGGLFHRTVTPANQPDDAVRIEVIQGGARPDREDARFPPLLLERTSVTGLAHRDGTLSMARRAPDSAVSDFFICIGDQPSLDFGGARNPDGQGFAAFGQVVAGMAVVRRIQSVRANGQALTPPVAITHMTRVAVETAR